MSTWIYKRTEPDLWTVGFYGPDGTWEPESDHGSRDEAADRVRYLNGGTQELVTSSDTPAFRRMLLLLKVQFDAGAIERVPTSSNGDAADLLYRLCEQFEVR